MTCYDSGIQQHSWKIPPRAKICFSHFTLLEWNVKNCFVELIKILKFSEELWRRLAGAMELIEVSEHDAFAFACNLFPVDIHVILPYCCAATCFALERHGFSPLVCQMLNTRRRWPLPFARPRQRSPPLIPEQSAGRNRILLISQEYCAVSQIFNNY